MTNDKTRKWQKQSKDINYVHINWYKTLLGGGFKKVTPNLGENEPILTRIFPYVEATD